MTHGIGTDTLELPFTITNKNTLLTNLYFDHACTDTSPAITAFSNRIRSEYQPGEGGYITFFVN